MAFLHSDHTPRKSGRTWVAETLVVLGILAFGCFVVVTERPGTALGSFFGNVAQFSPSGAR